MNADGSNERAVRRATALGEDDALFRAVVDGAPNGIVMVDRDGTIVLVNGEFERLFGYDRQELIGNSIELLVPLGSREQHPAFRGRFHDQPSKRTMGAGRDLFGRHKDGSEFPLEIGLNPIATESGTFVLASVVDISSRKRYEAELRRSNEELEQFAYVASHDLQEPLRMVASYTELLGQRYADKLDDRARKYIRYAVDGAKRMQLLINDLLKLSRVGSQGKAFEPTDCAEIVRRVLETLQHGVAHERFTFEVGALPTVHADEVQLEQVFQNLISNAVKFRSKDRPLQLRIAAGRQGGHWRFEVEDNGIGIEREHQDRVFQMFQRLHGQAEFPGSGIGLALARKIVERHGGRIWFDSQPGVGTTFRFTLPAGAP